MSVDDSQFPLPLTTFPAGQDQIIHGVT